MLCLLDWPRALSWKVSQSQVALFDLESIQKIMAGFYLPAMWTSKNVQGSTLHM
jgi:hypothetical protein